MELTERRRDAKERLAQAKQLQELLKPLENPRENFQGSLVTRDGELGKELERMKILLARVGGKLGDRIDVRESLEHTRGDSAKNRFDDILKRRGDEMVE